jgi:hypothetical protein
VADQLATPADLASAVQVDVDTASAALAIEVATAVVQAAAGQRIVRVVDDSEVVYGGSDRYLVPKERPVISVASVTYNSVLLTQGTASGTWRLSANGIWRDLGWTDCAWEPAPGTVVIYTHGYLPTDQGIQLGRGVALSLGKGLFVNPSGVVREQIDDYQVAYAEAAAALEATPNIIALLRRQYGSKAGMVRVF